MTRARTTRAPRPIAAVVLACVLGIACGEKEPPPVTAAKAFALAMRSQNVERVLPLLEKGANVRLEQLASVAGDHVGGRRVIEPKEMLQIVDVPSPLEIASAELVSSEGDKAAVALVCTDGTRLRIDLIYQDDSWRVRVPIADPRSDEPT
jgi:hypothetical protein